jgi:hypothetical protein
MEERDIALLARAGAVRSVATSETPGKGWTLTVNGEPVRSARQAPRMFKTLDAVASMLGRVGVSKFEVELR